MSTHNLFDGSPIIYAYTRDDAIHDGNLIPLSTSLTGAAGLAHEVALSRAAWEVLDLPDEEPLRIGQYPRTRLDALLEGLRQAFATAADDARAAVESGQMAGATVLADDAYLADLYAGPFTVLLDEADGTRTVATFYGRLTAEGRQGALVWTLMVPGED